MASLFRHSHKHPVSFLFLEILREFVAANPETTLGVAIQVVCQELNYTAPDLDQIAERLQVPEKSEASPSGSKSDKKSFGSGYLEWMQKQTPDVQCLIASRFDVRKAEYLYSRVDKNVAEDVLRAFTEHDWQQAVLNFEASMFGFGGSYGGGKGSKGSDSAREVVEVDMTKPAAADDLAKVFQGGFL